MDELCRQGGVTGALNSTGSVALAELTYPGNQNIVFTIAMRCDEGPRDPMTAISDADHSVGEWQSPSGQHNRNTSVFAKGMGDQLGDIIAWRL